MKGIRIINPGIYSSIQDLGRYGYREFGLPCSGAMDKYSFRQANYLCGNKNNEALIESLFHGLEFEFLSRSRFAVCGAYSEVQLNSKNIEVNRAYRARKGDKLRIIKVLKGARNYIAFSGGFNIDPHLGSCSTYVPASLGGVRGRELKQSDIIALKLSGALFSIGKKLNKEDLREYSNKVELQIMPGIDSELFPDNSLSDFLESEFIVSTRSDRMGIQLQSKGEIDNPDKQIISYGIHPGTIQLPPNGNPIIMCADCQTTGGYPQVANIISDDIDRCGQLKPGDKVRFVFIQQ